ncbi:MAG TPA: hypothetical protein VI413_00270 [Paludibacter sp.]
MKSITKTTVTLLFTTLFLFSCSGKFEKVSEDKFIGIWELKGTSIMDGTQIQIQKENNKLVGRIIKLNNNKYVKLFADSNEVWISEISRNSNFEFKLTESKLGKDLFSLYGQKTNQEYKAQFIDENTIGLATENSDPRTSTRIYKRVSAKL